MIGFVIDTDVYSGNFERELCAYITGVIGDCQVGSQYANSEYTIDGVAQVADENGCYRPCAIYTTPGYFNNGMGFQYKAGEEEIALAEYKKSVMETYGSYIKTVKSHRGKNLSSWTDDAIDREIAGLNAKIDEAAASTTVSAYPAYQSVIIYFDDMPSDDTIALMKERAAEYVGKFTIENYRIIGD